MTAGRVRRLQLESRGRNPDHDDRKGKPANCPGSGLTRPCSRRKAGQHRGQGGLTGSLLPLDIAAPYVPASHAMISITLPDGSRRQFERPLSGAELAAAIGPGLAKAALAVKIDGAVKDLSSVIERDARVEIVTRTHPDALDLLRHGCAHVLAEAVQELYPGTQITFGPSIENGFYYDFARDAPFTPDDFAAIEQRMREIVDNECRHPFGGRQTRGWSAPCLLRRKLHHRP